MQTSHGIGAAPSMPDSLAHDMAGIRRPTAPRGAAGSGPDTGGRDVPGAGRHVRGAHDDSLRPPVWRRFCHGMSLRRLALGGSALAWLLMAAIVASVLILNARESVREETRAAHRLASAFATMRLPTAFERRDMMAEARNIATQLQAQRHISAQLRDATGKLVALPQPAQPATPPAPGWFARLIRPPPLSEFIPIAQYPNILGMLEISADPADEIAEAWTDFRLILPLLAATALVAIGVTMAITSLLLGRLDSLTAALARMRAGDPVVRAPQTGLAELSALSDGVNALAAHLAQERARNRRLQARMMTLAEAERARIASDLHDGIGPELFALQAAIDQVERASQAAPGTSPDPSVMPALTAVSRHVRAIGISARAAIDDLRLSPAEGSDPADMLRELVMEFGDIAPQVRLDLDMPETWPRIDEAGRIALFRFVRESVLNALRHAAPSQIGIALSVQAAALVARVCDNGTGPVRNRRTGLGQTGMRDRATALGGTYLPPQRDGALTVTEFRLPPAPETGPPAP